MAKTGLLGPYRLTVDGISDAVARHSAGAYALGHAYHDGRFCIRRIGRADDDLGAKLRGLIGSDILFKFCYFTLAREAFEKECALFHDFGPPGNPAHPARPGGTAWDCPRCRFFPGRGSA